MASADNTARKSDRSGSKRPQPRNRSLKAQNRSLEANARQMKAVALISIVANLALLGLVGLMASGHAGPGGEARGEGLPTTQPPQNYAGQTREAYQVAQDIPAVIDGSYCYCYCEENFGHRSLLGCYMDDHAASCDICQNEALRVRELWDEGHSILDISRMMDEEYGG